MSEASSVSTAAALPPPPGGRRLDQAWCPGCGRDHGMGHCPRAVRLTEEALRRRGATFNWR